MRLIEERAAKAIIFNRVLSFRISRYEWCRVLSRVRSSRAPRCAPVYVHTCRVLAWRGGLALHAWQEACRVCIWRKAHSPPACIVVCSKVFGNIASSELSTGSRLKFPRSHITSRGSVQWIPTIALEFTPSVLRGPARPRESPCELPRVLALMTVCSREFPAELPRVECSHKLPRVLTVVSASFCALPGFAP